ncbi:helix-turn-helix domain-containing protein [Streptomyces chattanoogensis]|uniref:helix-turn-helix domain-containing protein n=1 Tax=Streptomyces chattanoogensis TaxID=66876 RepID=UPI003683BFE8
MREPSESHELIELLELLAENAPSDRFEEPVRRARETDPDPTRIARLERAKLLALQVHEVISLHHRRQIGLSALVDTARELTLPYDLDGLLNVIARRARFLLNLDMAWVSIHDSEGGHSVVRAAEGHISMLSVGMRVPTSGGLGNMVTARAAPVWTADYLNDQRIPQAEVTHNAVRAEGLRALIAVPLRKESTILGVLYAAQRQVRRFTPDEITLMSSLGDLAAVAIEKTRLLDRAQHELSELSLHASRAEDSSTSARRLNSAHTRLVDLVLRGGDLHTLADAVGELLDGTLLVRDPSGTNLTADTLPGLDETEIRRAVMEAHSGHLPVEASRGTWVCPVTAGEELLGTLVFVPEQPLDERQFQLLSLVTQVTAVSILLQRSTSLAEGQARSDVFHDLLNGGQLSAKQLDDHARRLSVDLGRPHVLVVARPEGDPPGRAAFWASSYAHQRAGIKSVEGDEIVLLLPGADAAAAGRAVAAELSAALGRPATVGSAGPVAHAKDLSDAYREAQRCVDALIALGSVGGTASTRELGFLGLLLSDQPNAAVFIADVIGPVLDYDAQQGTELTRTLEAYFAHGSSPTRAADTLHVHPNTVARRLERITELLGDGWQDSKQLLEVQLALRLHRIRHTVTARGAGPAVRR